jgi:CheY-like chemotaxis protein
MGIEAPGLSSTESMAMMYQKAGNSQKSMERLMDVEKACIQARGLTSQLLTFSKGGSPVVKTVSIAQLVKDTAAFALRGSNVGLNFTIEDGLWPAEIDSSQISQVINNLVINAKQAMPDGGIITIHAENTWVAGDEALPLIVGRYIRLSVKDTGSGIPEKDLPRVFDPYFTTKPEGHGLGLTICYTIVKKHNGHITVNSREGMGTVFSIYLPASGEEAKEELTGENTVVQGSGRILIVEDDKEVRSTIEGMLVQLGYEAECTAEGAAAVYAYCNSKKEGQPFDAVIMDLTICGGMGGKEAAGRILKMDPNARIIVSSGYSNDPVMSDYREYGFVNIAAKPYKIEELSRILHDVING